MLTVKTTFNIDKVKKYFKPHSISVGYTYGHTHPWAGDVLDLVEVVKKLYFGSPETIKTPIGDIHGVPERRFLTDPFQIGTDGFQELYSKIKDYYKRVFKNAQPSLQDVAGFMVKYIRVFVEESGLYHSTKPNSSKTIELKGSDIPLVNTGDMMDALISVVDGKKG